MSQIPDTPCEKPRHINPERLVPLDLYTANAPISVDLAYASDDNFMGAPIYRPGARLWLQEDLAAVVLLAARICHTRHGYSLVLYDGLRTVTAQKAMLNSQAVKDNPHWIADESRVLSLPGTGGHPRGWAVDLGLLDGKGRPVPMGTAFDELPLAGNGPDVNRAHRDYMDLPHNIRSNRKSLENCMTEAARYAGLRLQPLPTEWWDFRVPTEISAGFAPLSDRDLPPEQRMTSKYIDYEGAVDNFSDRHYKRQQAKIMSFVETLYKTACNDVQERSESHTQSCPPPPQYPSATDEGR